MKTAKRRGAARFIQTTFTNKARELQAFNNLSLAEKNKFAALLTEQLNQTAQAK
jgi:hypothetical protein